MQRALLLKMALSTCSNNTLFHRHTWSIRLKMTRYLMTFGSNNGYVTVCEGSKVNYTDVSEWFLKLNNEYQISTAFIGYDPWNSNYWIDEMKSLGFEMIEVRQGAKTMSNPMKQLEADLLDKKVNYNNNPVLKWCLTNTEVKRDENDNIRPVKRKKAKSKNRWCSKLNNCLLRFI